MQPEPEDPQYGVFVEAQAKRLKLRESHFDAIKKYGLTEDAIAEKTSKVSVIQKLISKLKGENRNIEQLILEMETLNITRFLDEVATIIASTCTQRETTQLAELSCRIAMLYKPFSALIIKELKKQMDLTLMQEDRSQLLALFHLTIELFVYGFPLPQTDISELIKKVFKAGLGLKETGGLGDHDKKERLYAFNIDMYWVFFKEFGEVFCELTSRRSSKWAKQGKPLPKFPEMVSVQIKKSISMFLDRYTKEVVGSLEQSLNVIDKMQSQLRSQLKLNGSFDSETKRVYKTFIDRYLKTRSKLLEISDFVSVPIEFKGATDVILEPDEISKQEFSISETGDIFEDEYQKELYVNLPSLNEVSPKPDNEEKQYDEFKGKLDSCKNVQDADNLSKLFLNVNTKKTRKTLVKDLLEYRKEYQLVTPYLCRIAATLNKKWKDIGETISELALAEYDKLKGSVSTNFVTVDKRTRNIKYICQLTKFQIVDPERTIACIKDLIDDLIGPNIDLLLLCLESVGRYLYLSKSSMSKFVFLLTQLKNVMNKKSMPLMVQSQINNCIALLKPSQPVPKKEKHPKTQVEKEVKRLLKHLTKDNIVPTVSELQKVLVDNEDYLNILMTRLLKQIPKHQYIENYLLAVLVEKFNSKELIAALKHTVKEKLIRAIETEENQECISWARFFGELFNYDIVSKEEFYGLMEGLLKTELSSTGVINVICTILDSSKFYLVVKKTSSINQKLRFILDFKSYINTRNYIPMFVEFEILDLLEDVQPEVVKLSSEEISKYQAYVKDKQSQRDKELNELKELEDFLKNKRKTVYKEKPDTEEYNREKEPASVDTHEEPRMKYDVEDEIEEYMKEEIEKSKGRLAKAKIAEQLPVKKKKGNEKNLVILGRNGDKAVRKEVKVKL